MTWHLLLNFGKIRLTLCLDERNKLEVWTKVRIYKLTYTNFLVWIHKDRKIEFSREWNLRFPISKFKFHVIRYHFQVFMSNSLKINK